MIGLLTLKDIHAKTHQGVQNKFGELFIRTNLFPFSIAQYIQTAFNLRQQADYDLDADITPEEAADLIGNANEFYLLAKAYVQKNTAESK